MQGVGTLHHWRQKNHERAARWPLSKSKTLIPELYRIGLAYGINPLTGDRITGGEVAGAEHCYLGQTESSGWSVGG